MFNYKINLSFKNKIAFTSAFLMAMLNIFLSLVVYKLVQINSYNAIDDFLQSEVNLVSEKYKILSHAIYPSTLIEWQEKEHNSLGRHAVFIQFMDAHKKIIEKSPNLKKESLQLGVKSGYKYYNSHVYDFTIRQVHIPVITNDEISGYIIIATPIEETLKVLSILKYSFLISFPFFLIILFLISRHVAAKSINPIKKIIDISNKISHKNLSERIPLLENKDELYILSLTINNLLDRLEKVIEREKSFISFTSHEFKTPLSVIKGTLQVLIRKPREIREYEQKAIYCISQVDKLNALIEDLLLLTQYETNKKSLNSEKVNINSIITEVLIEFDIHIKNKKLKISFNESNNYSIKTDRFMLSTIINNLISNAIKYSFDENVIDIYQLSDSEFIYCVIRNFGISINHQEIKSVFNPFYRSAVNMDHAISGHGLGLSIVKQFCLLLDIEILLNSDEENGTIATLRIPRNQISENESLT